jgi:methionyl-tRNA formyltransferase
MKYSKLPWVVLFGGAGREGVVKGLLSAGINIVVVFVPKKQSAKFSMVVESLKNLHVQIQEIDRGEMEAAFDGLEKAVLLSVGFPYIIPKALFSRHPLALNMHPTLLPKYRGPTTGAYILINNEQYTGSTVHLLDEVFDKGAVVTQSKVALSPFDTLRSMQRQVYQSEPALLLEAIDMLDSGFKPIQQDESNASTFPTIRKPEDSIIDPTRPLIELVNDIRACDPEQFPAFFMYHGEKVFVKLWRKQKKENEADTI